MSPPVPLFFPIETINRELDFRLLLAVLMAGHGRVVFVGQHDLIERLIDRTDGGVYLGKNVFKGLFPNANSEGLRKLHRHLVNLVHLDEEGGIYPGREERWGQVLDTRLDPRVLGPRDRICVWGDFQRQHYAARAPDMAARITVTGHPRFDLYRPELRAFFAPDADKLRARYGRFVLVNTNLSGANNGLGIQDTFSTRVWPKIAEPEARLHLTHLWAHQQRILAHLIPLLHRMAHERPDLRIILRPHPAEDRAFYRAVFSHCERVEVIHEGPVGAWLLAAEAIIQDGCTTGVEAYLAGKRVIAYESVVDERFRLPIPHLVGIRCHTDEDVLAALANPSPPQIKLLPEWARSMLSNFDRPAVGAVIETLERSMADLPAGLRSLSAAEATQIARKRWLLEEAKGVVRPFFRAQHARAQVYKTHFYGLDRDLIRGKVSRLEGLLGRRVEYQHPTPSLLIFTGSAPLTPPFKRAAGFGIRHPGWAVCSRQPRRRCRRC